MADVLAEIRRLNGLGGHAIAEPFAGGAGASLSLLFLEETDKIFINDADQSIHDFWWTLTNRPRPFIEKLGKTRASMAEWRRQRSVYRSNSKSRLGRGFSAFYLNRCNRSGIIMNGGPIGGVTQKGSWKIDARFPRKELIQRCEKISEYRERIKVSGEDGLKFIGRMNPNTTFFFIDPPYYQKGATLYLNALNSDYHESLAKKLRSLPEAAWVLTYDNCPEIRRLYRGWTNIRPFTLRYSASERRHGKELLISPKWLRLPSHQKSAAIRW